MKKKTAYSCPEMEAVEIELESSICSGSVDLTAQSPTGGANIQAQEVNEDFKGDLTQSEWE